MEGAMKKYKAIIYDLDGTLLNTIDMNIYPLMKIVEEELGVQKSFEELKHFFGYPGMQVMEALGIEKKEQVYQRWVEYVNAYPEGAKIYEPLELILKEFHEIGISQSIVSSKKYEQYQLDVERHSYDRYMDVVVLEEDTEKHKPHPDPLLLAVSKLKLQPKDVVYVGDSLADFLACEKAGIDFAYARWGSVSDEGIVNPSFILEKPQELRGLKRHLLPQE